jgi:hypothetical protein
MCIIHANKQTNKQTNKHTYIHTYIHTHTHTHKQHNGISLPTNKITLSPDAFLTHWTFNSFTADKNLPFIFGLFNDLFSNRAYTTSNERMTIIRNLRGANRNFHDLMYSNMAIFIWRNWTNHRKPKYCRCHSRDSNRSPSEYIVQNPTCPWNALLRSASYGW